MLPYAESSPATDSLQLPAAPLGDVATQILLAGTKSAAGVPVSASPQPPSREPTKPNTRYRRPVRGLTDSDEGPVEAPHWRSSHAGSPGAVTATGGPKLAPPSREVCTNML